MKHTISLFTLLLGLTLGHTTLAQVDMNLKFKTPYGHNPDAGHYANVNGIKMYYEVYGEGHPLLLIHGNGGDILSMGHQIEYFKDKYQVIVADSRGHGQSELHTDSLTYVQMAADWAELTHQLKLDSAYVIGWSDGGILALLLGIEHPETVDKIVTMGANLCPDSTAVYPWAVNWVKQTQREVAAMISAKDTTQNWDLAKQMLNLLGNQPTIATADLAKISVPVLLMAGDKDVIRETHTVEMYQHLPHAQLCILPGETHFAPATTPEIFNPIAARFLAAPFTRPDTNWTK